MCEGVSPAFNIRAGSRLNDSVRKGAGLKAYYEAIPSLIV